METEGLNLSKVKDGEEELILIHFNKQRIKSFKELINEYLILDRYYRKGQGKRTDLTEIDTLMRIFATKKIPKPNRRGISCNH